MITAGLTIEEYYEQWIYTECPFEHDCDSCEYDCGDDD